MTRTKVSNLSSAAIIFRAANPSEIFIEMKDEGYPLKFARNGLCLVGGNWIGESAKTDTGPIDTVRRELAEEISFQPPPEDNSELDDLDFGKASPVSQNIRMHTKKAGADDIKILDDLRTVICETLVPFGDFLKIITKNVVLLADPDCKKDGWSSITSCWAVALRDSDWLRLQRLQREYGNLSVESLSMVTSLDEIIRAKIKIAFGYDQVLKDFFGAMGISRAGSIPIVEHIEVENRGLPLPTYNEYFKMYDIERRPID